jgi:hypothetical protein
MISVKAIDQGEPALYEVTVSDGRGTSRHEVTVSAGDQARLTNEEASAEDLLDAAFRFLLDREPKESILGRFDITVISRYFPEFESEIEKYLADERIAEPNDDDQD